MTGFALTPPPIIAAPIRGSDLLFPVRRIYCVGRNYAAHAVEMGHDPDREPPFFFQKNPDNLDFSGTVSYPPATAALHHEVELVAALKSGGAEIPASRALDCVFGYAVGLDMTRRDLQEEAKRMGRPWEVGKAFERSAPLGPIVAADEIGHPSRGRIALDVNGQPRQAGDLDQMIWKTPDIIACLSRLFTLGPGDLIMTGTPAGVGPVTRGDRIDAVIEGVGALTLRVA